MVTDFARPSARIYQFPVSAEARREVRERRSERSKPLAASPAAPAFGGSWYHEEAIRETDGATKR
ncbi:DUF2735 domain-containing protein [Aquibium sp. LZ166]|uniref:DUF2735 domain-containing protein n=1 Tax=Aquibium pacificus TaxID=3153579 RepID=A0ABV3SIG8_9HYPH